MIGRLLRDPLTHFLIAGAALFVLHGFVAEDGAERDDRIVVTEERVAALAAGFQRTWMRPPSEAELRGLVEDFVTEEILYREALALGLDRDDLVVRRRMRQKMEFLTEDLATAEPGDAELSAFLRAHPERFALPARVSFSQVFLDPEAHADPRARGEALLARLRAPDAPAPARLGDPTLLPPALEGATAREVAERFGTALAERLAHVPEGGWHGPLASAFGLHLVRVDARSEARTPALDEVRALVRRELEAQRRGEARERFRRALRDDYRIELPASLAQTAGPPPVAGGP